ncbi:MAG: phage shock protein PspA [Sphingomonadales bacterium]|nr:phage shock protein PspA [Sphingomonadales bacterium]
MNPAAETAAAPQIDAGPAFPSRLDREIDAPSRLDREIAALRNDQPQRFTTGIPVPYNATPYNARRLNTGANALGIFSRTRDIIAANFNDLLERAEDPAKMIRLMILEMEETLVEVRSACARTIADQKEMRRHVARLDRLQADWADKAQLALSKDREDLARAALVEKNKAADMADQVRGEIALLGEALATNEADIEKLQLRLSEARTRQRGIQTRLQSAEHRVRVRTLLSSERVDEAMLRFDKLERRADFAEGRADALNLGLNSPRAEPSLSDQIAALHDGDKVDAELAAMKRGLAKDNPAGEA